MIFPPDLGWGERLAIAANHLVFELFAYGLLVMLLATERVEAGYLRAKAGLDRGAAAVLAGLELRLLVERWQRLERRT